MSEFDARARDWDSNPVHWERSEAIAAALVEMIPLKSGMSALEYGAGTGILSYLLSPRFSGITLMDASKEMVLVMHEKFATAKLKKLKPLLFDLEKEDYFARKFDCIYTQMVMHHVTNVNLILGRFRKILNKGGYLAIADLFPEDGSFHGPEAKVHHGFDPEELTRQLKENGFKNIQHKQCFEILRENGRIYPIFLLTAQLVQEV